MGSGHRDKVSLKPRPEVNYVFREGEKYYTEDRSCTLCTVSKILSAIMRAWEVKNLELVTILGSRPVLSGSFFGQIQVCQCPFGGVDPTQHSCIQAWGELWQVKLQSISNRTDRTAEWRNETEKGSY